MVNLSNFDRVLLVFLLLTAGIIFVSAAVFNPNKPYHPFDQVSNGESSPAGVTNGSGVLLTKYGGTGVASCMDGNILRWSGTAGSGSWTCGELSFTAMGLPASCSNQQVLKYNQATSTWNCADDIYSASTSGVDKIIAGQGIVVDPTTGTGQVTVGMSPCATNQILKYNGTNWQCQADNTGVTAPSICSSGKVLTYTATGWACVTPTAARPITEYVICEAEREGSGIVTCTANCSPGKQVTGGGCGGGSNGSGGTGAFTLVSSVPLIDHTGWRCSISGAAPYARGTAICQ